MSEIKSVEPDQSLCNSLDYENKRLITAEQSSRLAELATEAGLDIPADASDAVLIFDAIQFNYLSHSNTAQRARQFGVSMDMRDNFDVTVDLDEDGIPESIFRDSEGDVLVFPGIDSRMKGITAFDAGLRAAFHELLSHNGNSRGKYSPAVLCVDKEKSEPDSPIF